MSGISYDDPQNPVRFKPNAEIPTELDKTKVNYGLAQGISDGPSSTNLGTFVRADIPTAVPTVSKIVFANPFFPILGKFKKAPDPNEASAVPNIAVKNPSMSEGKLIPPPPFKTTTTLPFEKVPNGSVNLGGFLFVPEAGVKPENPA